MKKKFGIRCKPAEFRYGNSSNGAEHLEVNWQGVIEHAESSERK